MVRLYAGLDVGDRTTVVCIVDQDGKVETEAEADTTPDAIIGVLRPYRRRLLRVGLEAGAKSTWLIKGLMRARFPAVALDPFRAHSALRARLNKTDANDARGLAELLARGIYTLAHVKDDKAQRIRSALNLRAAIARKARDLKLTQSMTNKFWGPKSGAARRRRAQPQHSPQDEVFNLADRATTRAIKYLASEEAVLRKALIGLSREDEVCRRLMTIPGIGPFTALTFVAAIDDPTRFASSRHVGAYLGLTPRVWQSGGRSRTGGISRRGDTSARAALYLAAHTLLSISRSKCRLRMWGLRLLKEKGRKIACVACARKLSILMHRLWITGEEFDPTR